jgi:TonB family protein
MDDLEDLARRQARAQNGLDPSHARPQPWFVGSGRGLMLLVVTLVAVLIALRGVTTVWLAQDAWEWWTHRKGAASAGSSSARYAAAPRAIKLGPGAIPPRGDPIRWLSYDDYPPDAIRNNEEGRTVARLLIGANGRVQSCGIVTSSGSASLDAATCRAAVRRGMFEPAHLASGERVRSTFDLPVRWVLPRD